MINDGTKIKHSYAIVNHIIEIFEFIIQKDSIVHSIKTR